MDFKLYIFLLVVLVLIMYIQPNLLATMANCCLGKAALVAFVLYLALQDKTLGLLGAIILIVSIHLVTREGMEGQNSNTPPTIETIKTKLKTLANDTANEDNLLEAVAKALVHGNEWATKEPGTDTQPDGTMFIYFNNKTLPTLDSVKGVLDDNEYTMFYNTYKDGALKWPDQQQEQKLLADNKPEATHKHLVKPDDIPEHTHKVKHVLSEPVTTETAQVTSTAVIDTTTPTDTPTNTANKPQEQFTIRKREGFTSGSMNRTDIERMMVPKNSNLTKVQRYGTTEPFSKLLSQF